VPLRRLALACALLAPLPAAAQQIVAPSGQTVTLFDVVLEPDTGIARFRFLAPEIGPDAGARSFDQIQADMPWLCTNVAVPALAANDWTVTQVIVSLSDREIPLGATDPDAVQFFEGFRIDAATCIWEPY
jgi:hypothetical protein